MPSAPLLVLTDDAMAAHDPGPGHPERTSRLSAAVRGTDGLAVHRCPPRAATRDDLCLVHDPRYVDAVLGLEGTRAMLDPDTIISPASVAAARLAAGAALDAVDALIDGTAASAFALVRPPGHHAERARAMGFCLFHNLAIAVEHARRRGIDRVLVVDWDVHHGNGTMHAFWEHPDVLVFDVHRDPFYPGTGAASDVGGGAGTGATINVPVPARLGDGDYRAAFEEILVPAAQRFRPQLVLVSAGFDAHRDDPLGGMGLTQEGFATLCAVVRDLARESAGGRIGLVLEGGYDLDALRTSVEACARVLLGEPPPPPADPTRRGREVVADVIAAHARAS